MENEIRFFLGLTQEAMNKEDKPFVPTHIVTAVQLPTGAVEISVNTDNIPEKIEYILEAYDDDMLHKKDPEVRMLNVMVI